MEAAVPTSPHRLLPARPTTYRGIRMRSRLEADFARWLDGPASPWRAKGYAWAYEPECFADERAQYLPDFRLTATGKPTQYIEVKPISFAGGEGEAHLLAETIHRMETIWSSCPDAILVLVFWEWQEDGPSAFLLGWPGSHEWWLQDIDGRTYQFPKAG
jgi:hypothetical protein